MGVGAIAVTNDDFVILMKRAAWTGEAPGKIDRPGGHPEPDEILKLKSQSDAKDKNQFYEDFSNQEVLEEIFQSPQNELRDEINIKLGKLVLRTSLL